MNILESCLDKLERDVRNRQVITSFREYILNEAKQVGYIYHFTTLSRIEEVINNRKIERGKEGYVSLTRDFQLPNNPGYFNTGEYIVRITIDGNKLSNNTKIEPIHDVKYNDECEEGVLKSIDMKYFSRVDFLTTDTRVFSRTAIDAVYNAVRKNYNETYEIKKFIPLK